MAGAKLVALYPYPTDVDKFNRDYEDHHRLTDKTMQVPEGAPKPYEVIRFVETPQGKPAYFQMFVASFPSADAMWQSLMSPGGQALAADAARISSGGPPVFLFSVG